MELAVAILIQIFKKHYPEQNEQDFRIQLNRFFEIIKRDLISKLLIDPEAINLPGILLLCFYFNKIIEHCQQHQIEIKFRQADPAGNPNHDVVLDKIHMLFLALYLALVHQDENFIFKNIYILFNNFNGRKLDSKVHIEIIKKLLFQLMSKFDVSNKLPKVETLKTNLNNEQKEFEEIYKFIAGFPDQKELLAAELEKFIARSICNDNLEGIKEFIINLRELQLDPDKIGIYLLAYLINYAEFRANQSRNEELDGYMLDEYPSQCLAIIKMLNNNDSSFEINVFDTKIVFDRETLKALFNRIFSNILLYLRKIGFTKWTLKLTVLKGGQRSYRKILNNIIFDLYFKMIEIIQEMPSLDSFKMEFIGSAIFVLEHDFEEILAGKQMISLLELTELYIFLLKINPIKYSHKSIQVKVFDFISKYILLEKIKDDLIAALPNIELILKSQENFDVVLYKNIIDAFLEIIFLPEETTLQDGFDAKAYNKNIIAVFPFIFGLLCSSSFRAPQVLEVSKEMEGKLKNKLRIYIRDFVLLHPQEVSDWHGIYEIINYCNEVKDEFVSTMVRRVKRLSLINFSYMEFLEKKDSSLSPIEFQIIFLCYQLYIFHQAFTATSESISDTQANYYKMIISLLINCIREITRTTDKILEEKKLKEKKFIDFDVVFKVLYCCLNKLISSDYVEIRNLASKFYSEILTAIRVCLALDLRQTQLFQIADSEAQEQVLPVKQPNAKIILNLLIGTTELLKYGDFSTFLEDMNLVVTIFIADSTDCEFLMDYISWPMETFIFGYHAGLSFLLQRLSSEDLTHDNSKMVSNFLQCYQKLRLQDETKAKPMEPLINQIKFIIWLEEKFTAIVSSLTQMQDASNKKFLLTQDRFDKVIAICFNFLRNNVQLNFDLAQHLKKLLSKVPEPFKLLFGIADLEQSLDKREYIPPQKTDNIQNKAVSCARRRFGSFFPELANDHTAAPNPTLVTSTTTTAFGRS